MKLTTGMKKNIILLAVLVILYFGVGYGLSSYYGDSFSFQKSDYWEPDGNGGWVAYGQPAEPMPAGESKLPPLIIYYLPIFIPAFVLMLFLFTPLGRLLEAKKEDEAEISVEADENGIT